MDKVTVIQADRASAVEMLRGMWRLEHGNVAYGWMRDEESATLSGKRDDLWAVQAFAKHRLATPAPDSEKLREALRTATGLASGPNGSGRMKVVIDGLEPGQEHKLHHLLSTIIGATS